MSQKRRNNNNRKGRRNNNNSALVAVMRDTRNGIRDLSLHPSPMVKDVMPMRLGRNRVCSFAAAYSDINLTVNNSSVTAGALTFTLSNCIGSSDLIAVFDQYRIMQAIVSFEPADPAGTLSLGLTTVTALDYDDSATPASNVLEQYDTCLTVPTGTYFQRVVNPRIAYAAYGSGAFTSYANQKAGWLDVASPNVQHYGVKYYLGTAQSTKVVYFLKVQLFLQFRSQR